MSDSPAAPVPEGGRGRGAIAIVVAFAAAVATVAMFWGRSREAPQLTPTLEHLASLGGRNTGACLGCHRPDGPAPNRPAGHTPRHDCWNCHVPAS